MSFNKRLLQPSDIQARERQRGRGDQQDFTDDGPYRGKRGGEEERGEKMLSREGDAEREMER